jgi:hypothetical protein
METRITNWGVELALVRTHVGTEFDVVNSCAKIPSNDKCRFFGTYGYFDLAAISCFCELSKPYLVLLDRRIVESAPFRFFSDSKNQSKEKFERDLDTWPTAIVVLAKINQKICSLHGGSVRWIVSDRVRKELPEAHVFFGLGHSELLIIMGEKNLPNLLKTVTGRLRILFDGSKNNNYPLFSKTTTFPLLSCAQIHSKNDYGILDGEFEPVITASCEPAAERSIAAELKKQGLKVKNVYGKNDLLIHWKQSIKTSELAKFLTFFRHKWGANGILTKTTTYLESSIPSDEKQQFANPAGFQAEKYPELMTEEEERLLFERLAKIESPSIRAALSDLTLRLSACLNDPQLNIHYRDMANIFAYLPDLVESLGRKEQDVAFHASFTAETVTDLARAAMNQRYAGLEMHPETLAHAHAPLLCDIRTIVAAATCIPYYVFDKLKPSSRASELWAGFVLFGGSSSPQYLPQDILGLPSSSLFSPINVWWKITHEVAHAVFKTLEVYKQIPEGIRDYINESSRDSGIDDYHLINELFANWFDWKYVFNTEMDFYLKQIWASWVKLPLIWKSKPQYLARSFCIYICPKLNELISLLSQRWDQAGLPWLEAQWTEFTNILKEVPNMADYLAELSADEKRDIFAIAYGSGRTLLFFERSFEKKCSLENLTERLHPSYPKLKEHIQQLNEGCVITEEIIDPCKIHLELLRSQNGKRPNLATEIAYLFSLENTYLIRYTKKPGE